jgi:hypothetical protein
MVLCFDWLVSSGALVGCAGPLSRLAMTLSHALKVARPLHRVFLSYTFLGSLEGGLPRGGWPVQYPGGSGGRTIDPNFRFDIKKLERRRLDDGPVPYRRSRPDDGFAIFGLTSKTTQH